LAESRISHSLSGSRSGAFSLRSGCLATWKAPRLPGCPWLCQPACEWSGVGIGVVGVGRRGKNVFRVGSRRSAACRSWDGPTSFLSHHQRVITGAETAAAAADGGIARCCLRLSGSGWPETVPRSPRWCLGRDLRDARWQGMGGWVPACWVRRVGRLRPVLPLSPDSRGVGGMTQTVRHGSVLLLIMLCKLFTRPATGLMVSLIACGQRRRGRDRGGLALTRGRPPSSCRPPSPRQL